ncbi:hypothetical protein A2634_03350 [Candidatus Amesbacteria bacterium RIFCSPHIGHO2_01_FULL_48_32]|uniref:ComEC/Rec2-related protein domain-containing protein n=1 Tax=Candidatus Amesbacteria bacterium RIFCSPLOWO2_01_FULL_48_25 TaxID=1797259 RepID=A0A1F4ZFS8_9BACT|nr:MAG: hypothetical protein A2634_03350 [Candidatus Amesbacteria bacterium RIFCSPHIGHO2_01_FULL_48_32]OGD04294.1 MAG: hypothetical protein A2989_04615 [Candidatus Amesbacteria bacterium RIFCSPLOWO2_01_FULL_48_25]
MILILGFRVYSKYNVRRNFVENMVVKIYGRVESLGGGNYIRVEGIGVRWPRGEQMRYGQRFVTTGKLVSKVTKNGDTRLELQARDFQILGEENKWVGWIVDLKRKWQQDLVAWLGQDEGGLASGVLLGGDEAMSRELTGEFRSAGLSHITAASGYNVAVVAGWVMGWGWKIWGRRRSIPYVIFFIILYMVMAGLSAAVVRAGVMATLGFLGLVWGRKSGGWWMLGLTVWTMLVVNPDYLSDVGFLLSVAATVGVMGVTSLRNVEGSIGWLGSLGLTFVEDLKVTLAAQIMTLPIIWHYFGNLSVVAPISNLVVLWAVPVVMQILGVAVLAGVIWAEAGQLVSFLAWPLLRYVVWVVETVAGWSWANIQMGDLGWEWVAGYYLVLAICIKYWSWRR